MKKVHKPRWLSYAVLLLTGFLVVIVALQADIHPVPLDKNADSAKCLECHAENIEKNLRQVTNWSIQKGIKHFMPLPPFMPATAVVAVRLAGMA